MAAAFWLVLTLAVSSCVCDKFRILVVYPMPSRSHGILGDGVVRQLLKAGHEVTYITPFPYKDPSPNLREVDVSSNFQYMPPNTLNIKSILNKDIITNDIHLIKKMMTLISTKTLEHPNVLKLIDDPRAQFDVVLVEWMFSDLTAGFSSIFNCPYIWFSAVEVSSEILELMDAMPNPAHSLDFTVHDLPPFSFQNRVHNLWNRLKMKYWRYIYYDDMEGKEFDRLVGTVVAKKGRQPPTYNEVRYNASLMLGSSHVSMGLAPALPQSYKPIGGYHIDEDLKPLPEDLKKLMDNAKNGVIYFSMGSNLKSKDWPDEIKKGLLKMFGGLKQTVLWKFEEVLPDLPKNVHILKWAPQSSILSHPNCVIFISHGGLLSTTETIHYGVPIIGIPAFGDQFQNVQRSVSKGFAKKVDLSYGIVDELKAAIEELISNPRYRERVKELSFVYHHRPTKPAAELVHWVEHVVRTRGAPHLRSPALLVPLYQRLYLDLLAIIIIALIIVIVLLKRVCRAICPAKVVSKKKKK